MAALTFTQNGKRFESEWFCPNGAFQLDIMFPESDKRNVVEIYSANDDSDKKPYALAGFIELMHRAHLNVPITKVIPSAGVYYKVSAALNPISADYAVAS